MCGAFFLYISTDYVFDGRNPPYGEDDSPNPLNVYGRSKLEGERETLRHCPGSCLSHVPVYHYVSAFVFCFSVCLSLVSVCDPALLCSHLSFSHLSICFSPACLLPFCLSPALSYLSVSHLSVYHLSVSHLPFSHLSISLSPGCLSPASLLPVCLSQMPFSHLSVCQVRWCCGCRFCSGRWSRCLRAP